MKTADRILLAAPLCLLLTTLSTRAGATRRLPPLIYHHLYSSYTVAPYQPPCSLCHLRGSTGAGTADTPFALSMKARGLSTSDNTSVVLPWTPWCVTKWIVTATAPPTFKKSKTIRIPIVPLTSASRATLAPKRAVAVDRHRTLEARHQPLVSGYYLPSYLLHLDGEFGEADTAIGCGAVSGTDSLGIDLGQFRNSRLLLVCHLQNKN